MTRKTRLFPLKTLTFLMSSALCTASLANPVLGGGVVAGDATVSQAPNVTQVNQTSQQAIIEWNSFNIGRNESTHFQQPTGGVALNRIDAAQGASQIYGRLSATGQIILINGAGIYFGPTAQVNVGGLIASTSGMSNANFLAGKYIFDQPGNANSKIINDGFIKASDYGLVALMGEHIENRGIIQAHLGNIVLATGATFTLDFNGDQLVNFTIDQNAVNDGRIVNSGTLLADGGRISVSAKAASSVLDNAINMSGIAVTRSVSAKNGEIILDAGDGTATISGSLIATSNSADTSGGNISINANKINIKSFALLTADGVSSGGNITLAGKIDTATGDVSNAASININTASLLTASAYGKNAYGGSINVRGDTTVLAGALLASGDATGSYGGNIQITGTNSLWMKSTATIDASGDQNGGIVALGVKPNLAGLVPTFNNIKIDNYATIDASANGVDGYGGRISVYATNTDVNGSLNASAKATQTHSCGYTSSTNGLAGYGGDIRILADNTVHLGATARIDASGDTGGGRILIGGNQDGLGSEPTALNTTVDRGALINVSATKNGLGGIAVVWSNQATTFNGSILATGGKNGGDGGLVQVAGLTSLNNHGQVNVSAPKGNAGSVSYQP